MTLDEFAELNRTVIEVAGFENFLPTACFPERRHLATLANLPPELEPEKPVLAWAAQGVMGNEEFLIAFKVDDRRFKIIRCIGPYTEDEIFTATR